MRCLSFLVVVGLLSGGAVAGAEKKGYLGVQVRKVEGKDAIAIQVVLTNSPAEKAGLLAGDEILRVAGIKPADLQTFVKLVGAQKPGKKVKFLISRDGKEKEIEVEIGEI